MIPFLIAGGTVLTTLVVPEPVDSMNHTLLGVKVKAKEVVTRNMWGTPMMPTNKGSYSLIASPDPSLIERSLIQPPKTDATVFVPDKPDVTAPVEAAPEVVPATVPVLSPEPPLPAAQETLPESSTESTSEPASTDSTAQDTAPVAVEPVAE